MPHHPCYYAVLGIEPGQGLGHSKHALSQLSHILNPNFDLITLLLLCMCVWCKREKLLPGHMCASQRTTLWTRLSSFHLYVGSRDGTQLSAFAWTMSPVGLFKEKPWFMGFACLFR